MHKTRRSDFGGDSQLEKRELKQASFDVTFRRSQDLSDIVNQLFAGRHTAHSNRRWCVIGLNNEKYAKRAKCEHVSLQTLFFACDEQVQGFEGTPIVRR